MSNDEDLKNFIKQLHSQEYELDTEEINVRRLKEQRITKDKEIAKRRELVQKEQIKLKEQEANIDPLKTLENPKPEEFKVIRDPDQLQDDWRDKVSRELMEEFYAYCLEKLRKNQDFDWIMYSPRFASIRMTKTNNLTLAKHSQEWISCFWEQELQRYNSPYNPWVYYNIDGG